MEKNELIRDVAIYLRKSRGDLDVDLDKHRLALTELCEKMQCNYMEYAEIGTSDSIQDRPVFVQLLGDLEQGLYDAIAVIDIDRLGRGDDEDWGKIEKILKKNEILILTPDKLYDWSNENDEFQLDVKKFFARLEYKTITKRLRRGKILGAKKGKWTNGKPPYPYVYNKESQNLDVDEDKYVVYRQIIDRVLAGETSEQIAFSFNRLGIKSPGGKFWSGVAVYRLALDQTHLGKIVYAKQKGSGHLKNLAKGKDHIRYDRDDWQIVDGDHPPLKTQSEHDKIIELLASRKIVPTRARSGAFTLSGLLYCGKCKRAMGFTYNGKTKNEYIKKCQVSDPYGNRCGNKGVNIQIIVDRIMADLQQYSDNIRNELIDTKEAETSLLHTAIDQLKKDLKKEEKALEILQEQREDGEISKDRFIERKGIREQNIKKINKEIAENEERIAKREQIDNKQRIEKIDQFFELWETADDSEAKNRLLQRVVERIEYERVDDNKIKVKVNFI